MKNKAHGPGDCVTEMLQELSMESVYDITHRFEMRFRGQCRGKFYIWYFSRSLIRSWRKSSKISGCLGLLHEEPEPFKWASVFDECVRAALGVAGRLPRCLGSGILQVSDCVCGGEDGVRCGQAFRGV